MRRFYAHSRLRVRTAAGVKGELVGEDEGYMLMAQLCEGFTHTADFCTHCCWCEWVGKDERRRLMAMSLV